jgi:hypothetical protein
MAYRLGQVEAHVRKAADYFGERHGISNIGGWRAKGSVPGSDHPKGLALDYMTRSKSKGDALARDLIANAKAWNVKYVIWWRQIWHPGKGWSDYDGPSDHTDHVHASFLDKPGAGTADPSKPASLADKIAAVPGTITGTLSGLVAPVTELAGAAARVGKVADLITMAFLPTNIIRGVAAFAGLIFVLIGIWFLSREVRAA